jgi:hypothetical protein
MRLGRIFSANLVTTDKEIFGNLISRQRYPIMIVTLLFHLLLSTHGVHAAQSILKEGSEVFENILSLPDPLDPASWDYEWSFSGIRFIPSADSN